VGGEPTDATNTTAAAEETTPVSDGKLPSDAACTVVFILGTGMEGTGLPPSVLGSPRNLGLNHWIL
jgi:hypothetical protein